MDLLPILLTCINHPQDAQNRIKIQKKLWEQSRKKKRERGVIDEIKISKGFPKDESIQDSESQCLWRELQLAAWGTHRFSLKIAVLQRVRRRGPELSDTFIDSPEFPLEIHIL